ncbi:hypothetical protein PoB_006037800 [Plakobranchus ocellatus]|uniref:CUB domain-containing protein n=1 Tax=Plakobranchus ocellatus TaxID=259542 RepID=A0AAV4CPT0_9GAST|nr:hypothetical protein PoB_006037800 [Plakobranchus ocellatus]
MTSEIHTLYMNSYKDCGHTKFFPVNKKLMYKIEGDVSPDTATSSLIDCEMTFHAEDEGGRICISQEGIHGIVLTDSNLKLIATDGGDSSGKQMFQVEYKPSYWDKTEQCTTGPYLNLRLFRKSNIIPVASKSALISLKVMHISSQKRKFYLGHYDCGINTRLLNSDVSVYNRQKPQVRPSDNVGLQLRCSIEFKKEPSVANHSICIVYTPQGEPDCESRWTLYITDGTYRFDDDVVLYKLVCDQNNPKLTQMHAWCAASTIDKILIVHFRQEEIYFNNTGKERPEMYHVQVVDNPGGDPKALLAKIQSERDSKSASFQLWWLLLGLGIAVVVFILLGLICRCRRSKHASRDESKERPSSVSQHEQEDDEKSAL